MFTSETSIRVRYAETDPMGFVYYAHYAVYFEVARVESLRQAGIAYKDMEEKGILLPVLEYSVKFFKPAVYDDLLTVKTIIPELPGARIRFEYETVNAAGVTLNRAFTTLVFINRSRNKPCPAPEFILGHLKAFFPQDE